MYSLTGSVTLRGVTEANPTPPVPYVPGPAAPLVPQQAIELRPVSGPTGYRPVQIGDVVIDGRTIQTPVGPFDRARTRWVLGGAFAMSQSTPTWATWSAYLLIPCTGFLSLFLLLVKETDAWSSPLRLADGVRVYDTTVYSRNTDDYLRIRALVEWAQRPPEMAGPPPVNFGAW